MLPEHELYERLVNHKLFRGIDKQAYDKYKILDIGTIRHYKKDKILLQDGQKTNYIGLLLQGNVDVLQISKNGVQLQVHVLHSGQIIGMEVLKGKNRRSSFFYQSKEETDVFLFPIDAILSGEFIPDHIRIIIMQNLISILVHENTRQTQKNDLISCGKLREKIWNYLLIRQKNSKEEVFEIPYNREQLAAYLGVNRSALSRELSNMKREYLIDYKRNQFKILQVISQEE